MSARWMLAAVMLGALLAACGGGGGEKGGATPTVSGPVTINVWHTMTASNQDTLKSLVDRFNSSQNEVRVNLVYQGTPDECLTKVLAVLGTSDVPAVVQLLDIHTRLMVDSAGDRPRPGLHRPGELRPLRFRAAGRRVLHAGGEAPVDAVQRLHQHSSI